MDVQVSDGKTNFLYLGVNGSENGTKKKGEKYSSYSGTATKNTFVKPHATFNIKRAINKSYKEAFQLCNLYENIFYLSTCR